MNCDNLTSVVISDSVRSIGKSAFNSCSSLTRVVMGNSVTSIGENAFLFCDSLIYVEIGNSVKNIGVGALGGPHLTICCEATEKPSGWSNGWCDCKHLVWGVDLVNVVWDTGLLYCLDRTNNTAEIISHDGRAVQQIPDNIIVSDISYSVNSLGYRIFYRCNSLTSIKIGNNVTNIGESTFYDCDNLTSVEIGNSVTNIDEEAFEACESLKNLVIGNSVTNIGDRVFFGCRSLTSIEIPDSVISIGKYAFRDCSSLTSIEIPDSVTSIGIGKCFSTNTSITVDINNPNYKSIDGNLYSKDGTVLVQYTEGGNTTKFIIPYSVTSIADEAFGICDNLASVVIPDSVTSIGKKAFWACRGLTRLEIPDSVTSISEAAFYACHNLTIFCEATEKPSGWDSEWNKLNSDETVPAYWGR